jgi:hypothetical protein
MSSHVLSPTLSRFLYDLSQLPQTKGGLSLALPVLSLDTALSHPSGSTPTWPVDAAFMAGLDAMKQAFDLREQKETMWTDYVSRTNEEIREKDQRIHALEGRSLSDDVMKRQALLAATERLRTVQRFFEKEGFTVINGLAPEGDPLKELLQSFATTLAEKDARIAALEATIARPYPAIASLEASLRDRDAQIAALADRLGGQSSSPSLDEARPLAEAQLALEKERTAHSITLAMVQGQDKRIVQLQSALDEALAAAERLRAGSQAAQDRLFELQQQATLRSVPPSRYVVEYRPRDSAQDVVWQVFGVATTQGEADLRAKEKAEDGSQVRVLSYYRFVPTEPQAFLGLVEGAVASANRTNDELRAGLVNVAKLVEEGAKREAALQRQVKKLDESETRLVAKMKDERAQFDRERANKWKQWTRVNEQATQLRLMLHRAQMFMKHHQSYLPAAAQGAMADVILGTVQSPAFIEQENGRRVRTLEVERKKILDRMQVLEHDLAIAEGALAGRKKSADDEANSAAPSQAPFAPAPVTTVAADEGGACKRAPRVVVPTFSGGTWASPPPSSPGSVALLNAEGISPEKGRYADIASGGTMRNPPGYSLLRAGHPSLPPGHPTTTSDGQAYQLVLDGSAARARPFLTYQLAMAALRDRVDCGSDRARSYVTHTPTGTRHFLGEVPVRQFSDLPAGKPSWAVMLRAKQPAAPTNASAPTWDTVATADPKKRYASTQEAVADVWHMALKEKRSLADFYLHDVVTGAQLDINEGTLALVAGMRP